MAKIIMAMADKGGTAKSTASHLTILAVQDAGKSVHIIDTDAKNSDLVNHFGSDVEYFDLYGHLTGIGTSFQALVELNSDSEIVVVDTPAGSASEFLKVIDGIFEVAAEAGNELSFIVPVNASIATQAFAENFVNVINGRAKTIIFRNCFNSVTVHDFEKGEWSRREGINKAKKEGQVVEFDFGDLLGVYAQNLYATKRPLRDLLITDFSYLRNEMKDQEKAELRIAELSRIYDRQARRHLKNWYYDHTRRLQEAFEKSRVI